MLELVLELVLELRLRLTLRCWRRSGGRECQARADFLDLAGRYLCRCF